MEGPLIAAIHRGIHSTFPNSGASTVGRGGRDGQGWAGQELLLENQKVLAGCYFRLQMTQIKHNYPLNIWLLGKDYLI